MSGGLDGQVFRQAMAALPTGVSVLTTIYGAGVHGMTVGSLTSVSLSPALISVCLRRDSPSLRLIRRNDDFGLSLLADEQISVANCFATPERETDSVEYVFLEGVPVVSGAVGWLVCTQRHIYPAGDHAIVVGAVSRAESRAGEPLIRHRSRYRHLNPEEEPLVTPR